MFKFYNFNPFEALYLNSLAVFCITIFLLLTFTNRWFGYYRRQAHESSYNIRFPDNTDISELSYTERMKELQNFTKNLDESPKSLKYFDDSIVSSNEEEKQED
jgi:hypothetical protein